MSSRAVGGSSSSWRFGSLFSFILSIALLVGVNSAWAANCYWAGGTSSDWGTVANWTEGGKVPNNDGAYFRSDKFHNNFKSGDRAYLVTFNAAHTNNWRTFFNNCGTASAPIVLRATNSEYGLTSGDSTSNKTADYEGIYIGTNQTGGNGGTTDSKASTGNTYVRFETGTYATRNTCSYFFLGNNSYDGHMTVAGATINTSSDFKIFSGSLTIESGTVTVASWTRFEKNSRSKAINLNGGTLATYYINTQADLKELEQDIKPTGFYHNKAKNIISCARTLVTEYGSEVPSELEALTSLAGVGRKTANVIRGNIFHEPSIVVDTHVKRISNKLGFTKEEDPVKIEFDLMEVLPKDHWILFNIHIITLGRTICTARSPKCEACFLREYCKACK